MATTNARRRLIDFALPVNARWHLAAAECTQPWAATAVGAGRGAEILKAIHVQCTRIATQIDSDPTLLTEPAGAVRFRDLDVYEELLCQLMILLPRAAGTEPGALPEVRWWPDIEAIHARATRYAERIIANLARSDHATVQGSQKISDDRLIANLAGIRRARDELRYAIHGAANVVHPSPRVFALQQLVEQMDRHVAELHTASEASGERLAGEVRSVNA